ncbi:glycosyltransferase family 2 protein [Paenibacillus pini]|uniref:Glycosyltransferase n=1 Tax=Paenibacillus pini JCM 16418 TaxID=1236976 RepID=W7Z842_9BACL|nr:glycosyltransferase family 2 protein [Paenibacillus pini]GAF10564.1 glycosyltransferase [Paenibacillus pini JCM 16418]
MITISLCMIVKNEETALPRCLASVASAVDQIIIVDTGSTDNTISTAQPFKANIHTFQWIDDFSAARNYAFSLADQEYILWLDADDVLKEEDLAKLITLKETLNPMIDSVTMNYNLAFDEYGNTISSLRRNRLVKRSNQFRWIGQVHEYLEVSGQIHDSDISVTHCGDERDSDRNLHLYLKKWSRQEPFSPRDTYYFANELLDHHMHEMAVLYYRKFLDQGLGWVEDNIAACGKVADCYHALGEPDKEMQFTLKSFEYASPRPEFCCRLGFHFLEKNDPRTSLYWYLQAVQMAPPADHWAIRNNSCSTWLPHLQLCVCYDRLGEHELAYQHNELARKYRPEDKAILANKLYLESILQVQTG